MIQKIRRRFIRIALLALAVAMVLVTVVINLANRISVEAELQETLRYIAESDGGPTQSGRGQFGRSSRLGNALLESRYFTAVISSGGLVSLRSTDRDRDADEENQRRVAASALTGRKSSGYEAPYLYLIQPRADGTSLAVFLNIENRLEALRSLAVFSALACAGGILLAWLLVSLISSRAIRPLIESAVKQKEFITDAGHELKTPLAVISANMDVLSMDLGENEWVQSTRRQVKGMGALVNQMVYLSRMDEDNAGLQMSAFDLSRALRETAETFGAMAELSGGSMQLTAPESLMMTGDEAAIRRLIGILCDNALKYSPEGDSVSLSASQSGRRVVIEAENTMKNPLKEEDLKRLFDRFYRPDVSRSKEQGGFGIGLAIVRAVAEKHRGRVSAQIVGMDRLRIVCWLEREGKSG